MKRNFILLLAVCLLSGCTLFSSIPSSITAQQKAWDGIISSYVTSCSAGKVITPNCNAGWVEGYLLAKGNLSAKEMAIREALKEIGVITGDEAEYKCCMKQGVLGAFFMGEISNFGSMLSVIR
jgi:uncharacterized protein YceK